MKSVSSNYHFSLFIGFDKLNNSVRVLLCWKLDLNSAMEMFFSWTHPIFELIPETVEVITICTFTIVVYCVFSIKVLSHSRIVEILCLRINLWTEKYKITNESLYININTVYIVKSLDNIYTSVSTLSVNFCE